jgi:hypothetical protein
LKIIAAFKILSEKIAIRWKITYVKAIIAATLGLQSG